MSHRHRNGWWSSGWGPINEETWCLKPPTRWTSSSGPHSERRIDGVLRKLCFCLGCSGVHAQTIDTCHADQNLRFKKRPAALITVEKRWACTPCKPRDALRLSPGHYLGGSNSTNQINFKENKHTLLWIQPYHLRKYDSCDDWGLVKSLRKYLDPQGS